MDEEKSLRGRKNPNSEDIFIFRGTKGNLVPVNIRSDLSFKNFDSYEATSSCFTFAAHEETDRSLALTKGGSNCMDVESTGGGGFQHASRHFAKVSQTKSTKFRSQEDASKSRTRNRAHLKFSHSSQV